MAGRICISRNKASTIPGSPSVYGSCSSHQKPRRAEFLALLCASAPWREPASAAHADPGEPQPLSVPCTQLIHRVSGVRGGAEPVVSWTPLSEALFYMVETQSVCPVAAASCSAWSFCLCTSILNVLLCLCVCVCTHAALCLPCPSPHITPVIHSLHCVHPILLAHGGAKNPSSPLFSGHIWSRQRPQWEGVLLGWRYSLHSLPCSGVPP